MAAAAVFFCLMSVYLVYSVRGGALIQALCASAPLFYYCFVLFYVVHRYYPSFCHVHPVNKHCDDDDDDDVTDWVKVRMFDLSC